MIPFEVRTGIMRMDPHIHTKKGSPTESTLTATQLVNRCAMHEIKVIGLANHKNKIEDGTAVAEQVYEEAEEVRRAANREGVQLLVIPGMEITILEENSRGKVELLVYNPPQGVYPGIPYEELLTIAADKRRQNGITVPWGLPLIGIPHFIDEWRGGAGAILTEEIVKKARQLHTPCLLEIHNQHSEPANNDISYVLAKRLNALYSDTVIISGGSDTHHAFEVGSCAMEISSWKNERELLEKLKIDSGEYTIIVTNGPTVKKISKGLSYALMVASGDPKLKSISTQELAKHIPTAIESN